MRRHNRSTLDCICERLLHSRNAAEQRSLLLGRTCAHNFPVLLDSNLLFEHMHIVGPTGIGKSTLGLHTNIVQLIYKNDGPVVIFDGKGDPALFHAAREAAGNTGRNFKWFTNKPNRSTYVFNPWTQKGLYCMTLPDVVALFMQALNLVHGEDYGRGWYHILNRTMMRRGVELTIPDSEQRHMRRASNQSRLLKRYQPIQSFYDLKNILEDMSRGDENLKEALHLCYLVESLTDFEQLNLSPNQAPNHPALAHAIHMPEVIREKQVIYFYLSAGADLAMVSMIIKLALFSLLAAAGDYLDEHGKSARIYTIFDEAQVMIAQNIANVVTMARSLGLAMILSHQALSQLNPPGGADLREIIMSCTANKLIFGVRDPWLMDYISKTSGLTRYFRPSYNVSPECAMAGMVGPDLACPDSDGETRINIREHTGPRMNSQDILNASRGLNTSLMWIDRSSGLSLFNGWFPMYTDWPTSMNDYKRRSSLPWPATNNATIKMSRDWPDGNEHTITPTRHPQIDVDEEKIDTSSKLRDIRRRLEDN